jgi:N-acetylmuramoyl-L-alanine amidase
MPIQAPYTQEGPDVKPSDENAGCDQRNRPVARAGDRAAVLQGLLLTEKRSCRRRLGRRRAGLERRSSFASVAASVPGQVELAVQPAPEVLGGDEPPHGRVDWTAIGIEHVGDSDREVLEDGAQMAASLKLVHWLRCRYHIAIGNVIGHAESLSSPYHREDVPSLRTQTHSDFGHADMRVYRQRLAQAGDCPETALPTRDRDRLQRCRCPRRRRNRRCCR